MLRRHQKEILDIARLIKSGGARDKSIVAQVTPGGGKSLLPVILAAELIGVIADRICWVVPRNALQEQAEQAFTDPEFRRMLVHDHAIRVSTNEPDPSRGLAGYATTYAALSMDERQQNLREFSERKYILVLDEPHHIAERSAYEKAVAPLVERAALTLYMSGTLERDDDRRIAFMPYKARSEEGQFGHLIDMTPSDDLAVVQYSRVDALVERAIIRLTFNHVDAAAEWYDRNGEKQRVKSLESAGKKSHEALWTAISTQFANALIDKTLDDWRKTKRENPRSKLLIVAARQSFAKQYADYLRLKGIECGIATMDEGPEAMEAINRFKSLGPKRYDALVTVQMAYEGLDCKPITHIACLTNIRSKPWIEQMLARATRFDHGAGAWTGQVARVFLPDDPLMKVIIRRITKNDENFIAQKKERVGGEGPSGGKPIEITPMASSVSSERASELISEEERHALEEAIRTAGIVGVTPIQLKKAIALAGYSHATELKAPNVIQLTPSQEEEKLKDQIEQHVREYARKTGKEPRKINAKIVEKFGKSRTKMTLPELRRVWTWIQTAMPVAMLFGN
jgi:superfamily II DNA or RNA helicase